MFVRARVHSRHELIGFEGLRFKGQARGNVFRRRHIDRPFAEDRVVFIHVLHVHYVVMRPVSEVCMNNTVEK